MFVYFYLTEGTNIIELKEQSDFLPDKFDYQWFDDFYKKNRNEFLGWAKKRTRLPKEDLTDIYQNSMLILYENMKAGKTDDLQSSLKTYLFGIAQNLILKVHRKEEVNSRHETRLSEHWLFQSQPMESLDHLLNKTARLMRQLTEPCLSIIRSFYMERMSLDEIAEQMNYRSADVVKSQKSRCVKKMKELANV